MNRVILGMSLEGLVVAWWLEWTQVLKYLFALLEDVRLLLVKVVLKSDVDRSWVGVVCCGLTLERWLWLILWLGWGLEDSTDGLFDFKLPLVDRHDVRAATHLLLRTTFKSLKEVFIRSGRLTLFLKLFLGQNASLNVPFKELPHFPFPQVLQSFLVIICDRDRLKFLEQALFYLWSCHFGHLHKVTTIKEWLTCFA